MKAAPCAGCKSVEVMDGMVSFCGDKFCTSSKFPESKLYAMARQICVRSLSCERGQLVVFGEEGDPHHVLSFQFHIADSQSRGFSRMYSFCVLHPDVTRWSVSILKIFENLRDEMREKANLRFNAEQKAESLGGSHISLRRVPKGATVRSLVELLFGESNDQSGEFFSHLHSCFSQLLFAMDQTLLPAVAIGECFFSVWGEEKRSNSFFCRCFPGQSSPDQPLVRSFRDGSICVVNVSAHIRESCRGRV